MSSIFPINRRKFLINTAAASAVVPMMARTAHAGAHFVRIGVLGKAQEEIWQVVATNAKHQSIVLEIVAFDNCNDIDDALAERKIDINAFQDRFFLADQNSMKGYSLMSVGQVWLAPLAMYSSRYSSLALLPSNNLKIAIADEPTNEARALFFLQKKGYIRLPKTIGPRPTTIDIIHNVKKCHIEKMPLAQLPDAMKQCDIVLMPSDYLSTSELKDPNVSASLLSQEDVQNNPYMCLLVVNTDDMGSTWIGAIQSALQRPNVEQAITHTFQGSVYPAWKF